MAKRSLLLLATSALCLFGQETAQDLFWKKLGAELASIDQKSAGVVGAVVIDLSTGRVTSHNADTTFPQASLIKVPILIRAFAAVQEGKLQLEQIVTLTPAEKVGGSGHLQDQLASGQVRLTFRELLVKMIEDSDNTATNKVIALLGMETVNAQSASAGSGRTKLQRIMMDTNAAKTDRENLSTPMEMARLMESIYRGKAVSPESSRQMVAMLSLVKGALRAAAPAEIVVAAKVGELTGVRTEAGIVFLQKRPYLVSMMAAYLPEGQDPLPEAARLIFRYMNRLDKSNSFGNQVH